MVSCSDVKNLVIGANGLVGRQMCVTLKRSGLAWTGTFNKRAEDGLLRLNVTDKAQVKNIFESLSPKNVFLCANLAGGVDFCQANPELGRGFYLDATCNIADFCKKIDAMFVFISTDYVFDGTKDSYKEDDDPNPLNLYGLLKLEAERWIEKNLRRYLIIRTTNIYGWDHLTVTPNYIMNLYRTIKAKRNFNTPSFLWGNPTYVTDLTDAIYELCTNEACGIFHVVGSSFINRFQWAKYACDILGLDFSLLIEVVQPNPGMIPRPLKSCLDTSKFRRNFKSNLHDVVDGLKMMKECMGKCNE